MLIGKLFCFLGRQILHQEFGYTHAGLAVALLIGFFIVRMLHFPLYALLGKIMLK
ncbi:MAG: hypothetical protein RIQ94_707, partial [Pseudomonadota bacterium]